LREEKGLGVKKIHELNVLLTPLLPDHPALRSLRRGLVFLSDFAVDPRYPGKRVTKRQAVAALRWASRVRTSVRALLGIRENTKQQPPPGKPKKKT